MKLIELLNVTYRGTVELHSAKDGKFIARSRDSLNKYGNVEVRSVYPKLSLNRDCNEASAYLYVFGDNADICKVQSGGLNND